MAPPNGITSDDTYSESVDGSVLDAGDGWLARRERSLWALAVLALCADVVTTVVGLESGLAEGNPLIAATLADVGVAGFLTIKAAVLLGAYYCRLAVPRHRVAIPLGVALPWLAATATNAVLLVTVA